MSDGGGVARGQNDVKIFGMAIGSIRLQSMKFFTLITNGFYAIRFEPIRFKNV